MEQEIWKNLSIEDLPGEEWRDILGYEGKYMVSSFGRIKSLNYKRTRKEQILSLGPNNKGYLLVLLCKNGKIYTKFVHRLVAIAFIPNPENKREVHHIDGNTQNNMVSNLLWVSRKEHRAIDSSKKVLCVETGKVYESTLEAERCTRAGHRHISECCRGKRKTTGGYHWKYAD